MNYLISDIAKYVNLLKHEPEINWFFFYLNNKENKKSLNDDCIQNFIIHVILLLGMLTVVKVLVFFYRIIGRGSMFVFSNRQFQELMGISENWKAQSLLDLGKLNWLRLTLLILY